MTTKLEKATLANGCFWCTEAIFQQLKGVTSVRAGYTGGTLPNPSYEAVSSGSTQHAEAIRLQYDPSVISFREILEVFFATHDPTTLNRQGYDVGTQYRSAVFYHNEFQKLAVEAYIEVLEKSKVFKDPIVTEVVASATFYLAEDYHQNYYNNHKDQPYCRAVISPKMEKFLQTFRSKIKSD
ncbi:MAG: peptide-methionine (S)-S-oxide reductase MsrA [Lutibacter sp.]|nr:peptide-methionine (S)-S-oxide reductase MsrA [Lutibacter sp.]